MVKVCAVLEPVIWLGLSNVMEGAGGAFTWKFTLLETCPSGFVTVTAKARVVSPTMRFTWIPAAVTDISCELASMVEPICSVSPGWKPVPAIVRTCPLLEPVIGFGLSAPIAGGVPVTCKAAVLEAGPVVLIAWTARFCEIGRALRG